MTTEEMKRWINKASYEMLLSKWRSAPIGSPWFMGEIGDYYSQVMKQKRAEVGDAEHSKISKRLGPWRG